MTKTLAATLDASQLALMDQAFLISDLDRIVYDQFVTWRRDIMAKSIEFPEYAKLALATTALTDGTAATPTAMSDTQHIFTPEEYGIAVQPTTLAELATSGKARQGAAQLVGINRSETGNRQGFAALAAGTNITLANDAVSEAAIVAGDTPTESDIADMFTGLAANNAVQFSGPTGPAYVGIVHPHVAHDIKALDGWTDAKKYADPENLLRSEIGMYEGIRFLATTGNDINTDSGAGTVDTYDSVFFGMNALGKAISKDPALTMFEDGSDPHRRSVFIGWYGVYKYGIVDQNALQVLTSASSKGTN